MWVSSAKYFSGYTTHSLGILKYNKGSFRSLQPSLSLWDCDPRRQLCPERRSAKAETSPNYSLLRNSRQEAKSKTFPTVIKAEGALRLPGGETEYMRNNVLTSQSQMETGISATRYILVRTVQFLRFPV